MEGVDCCGFLHMQGNRHKEVHTEVAAAVIHPRMAAVLCMSWYHIVLPWVL